MSPMWTLQQTPSSPHKWHRTTPLSADGEIIWQALLERHRKKQQARENRLKPVDAQSYYKTLYQRCFGTPQSVRNFETSSVRSSQFSVQASPCPDRRLYLPETPTLPSACQHNELSDQAVQPLEMSTQPSTLLTPSVSQQQISLEGSQEYEANCATSYANSPMEANMEPNRLQMPRKDCFISRFNHDQQFLQPMFNDFNLFESVKNHVTRQAPPAAASKLSDLENSSFGSSEKHPTMGHFDLGCEILGDSQIPTQESAASTDSVSTLECSLDPSQSLFTQPENDHNTLESLDIEEQSSSLSVSSSPPLDLSPSSETFHLLKKPVAQKEITVSAEPNETFLDGQTRTDNLNPASSEQDAESGDVNLHPKRSSEREICVASFTESSKTFGDTDCQLQSVAKEPSSVEHTSSSFGLSSKSFRGIEETLTEPSPLEQQQSFNSNFEARSEHPKSAELGDAEKEQVPGENERQDVEEREDALDGKLPKRNNQSNVQVSSVTRRLKELQNKLLSRSEDLTKNDSCSTPDSLTKTRKRVYEHNVTGTQHQQIGSKGAKKCKKSSFSTPFKAAEINAVPTLKGSAVREPQERSCLRSRLKKVTEMSENQREEMRRNLQQAKEVALTLMYDDGSTQLRELPDSKKKKTASSCNDAEATGFAMAYPVTSASGNASTLHYASFPVGRRSSGTHLHAKWCRKTLGDLMTSETRKLCFDAQELIQTLLNTFQFENPVVSSKWQVIDPRIAGWLLQPDSPPVIFRHLLTAHPDLKQSDDPEREDQVCSDLGLLGPVMLRMYEELTKQNLWDLFMDVEVPLSPILAVMERRGIKINKQKMTSSCSLLKKQLKRLESQAHQAAGHSFVLNSHAQLRQVLFEEMQLDLKLPGNGKKIARTSVNQQKSTSEAVLTQLQDLHPLPNIVLEYRQLQKLKSTYVDGMMMFVEGGELRTHWDQTAAATGRLTSTNPNIQAVPKQPVTLTGVKVNGSSDTADDTVDIYARAPFQSREGYSLLAADFQQIELRLLAHFSGDKYLLDVFNDPNSQDIFVDLTSQWLNKSKEKVTQSEREQTKRVVYSVMYGAGKDRLAEYLKISSEEANGIMLSFLVTYPGVSSYTKTCVEQARRQGYQCTLLQRRRWFPHIKHVNSHLKAQAERQAVNFCIQGSAADLCKVAMIQVEHTLSERTGLSARFSSRPDAVCRRPVSRASQAESPDKSVLECREVLGPYGAVQLVKTEFTAKKMTAKWLHSFWNLIHPVVSNYPRFVIEKDKCKRDKVCFLK